MIKYIFIVISLFTVTGCGGGSSDTASTIKTPANSNQTFSLANLQSTVTGTIYTAQLTGSDTNGVNYSGFFSIVNQTQTMLNGILTTPHNLVISLRGGGTSINVTGLNSIDGSGYTLSKNIQSTGLMCTPVSPDSIPTLVKIGDSGMRSTLTCDDNTTSEGNWRIEDGGNGTIRYISNATIKDQFNSIISVTDVTFTLNSDGDILSFETVATINATNFSISYGTV